MESFIGVPIPEGCAYLPPNRPCILSDDKLHQSNFYLGLDFLYWQGGMNGLEYAFSNIANPTIAIPSLEQKGSVQRLHFQWEPAVRCLIGYHLPYDHWWNLDFAFTYYHTTVDNRAQQVMPASAQTTGLIPVWTAGCAFQGGLNANWTDASAHWNFKTYIYDLVLRHSLCIGSALSVEPAFGLKMATLQQYYKVKYTNGLVVPGIKTFISSDIGMKCRSFNLGPQVALASQWRFGGHWNLFGSISAALFGTHFTASRDESDILLLTSMGVYPYQNDLIRINDRFWGLRPQSALQLGISWNDCICRKDSVIAYGFSAAYEAQYFWKQNMLLRYVDGLFLKAQTAPTQGDLFLHGLTVNAHIDF